MTIHFTMFTSFFFGMVSLLVIYHLQKKIKAKQLCVHVNACVWNSHQQTHAFNNSLRNITTLYGKQNGYIDDKYKVIPHMSLLSCEATHIDEYMILHIDQCICMASNAIRVYKKRHVISFQTCIGFHNILVEYYVLLDKTYR